MSTIFAFEEPYADNCRVCSAWRIVLYADRSLGHDGVCSACIDALVNAENALNALGFRHPPRELVFSRQHRL